jgi:Na+/H+ antiporter NhaA
MIGVAFLAGIGFTMSLFISGFAFSNPLYIKQAKYGILIASFLRHFSDARINVRKKIQLKNYLHGAKKR